MVIERFLESHAVVVSHGAPFLGHSHIHTVLTRVTRQSHTRHYVIVRDSSSSHWHGALRTRVADLFMQTQTTNITMPTF